MPDTEISVPPRPPPPITVEQLFGKVEEYYHTSLCYVSNGLTADEQGDTSLAIQLYINALQCLEKGVTIDLQRLSGDLLSQAQAMRTKMVPALESVRSRLYELQEPALHASAPEYSSEVPEGHSRSFAAPTNSNHLNQNSHFENLVSEEAVVLLHIPGGVQLFMVGRDFDVNTPPPSYPSSLKVLLFDNSDYGQASSSTQPSHAPAFVQVGDWVYPLMPGQSPVLLCNNGAYMFPNVTNPAIVDQSSQPDSIGLVISSALDPSYSEIFSNILTNMACLQVQGAPAEGETVINLRDSVHYDPAADSPTEEAETTTSDKIAAGIETGASWLSWGLAKGAELTTSLIKHGATHLQRNIKPDDTPASVNPNLQKGLYYTHEATKVTVKVSGAILKGLTTVTGEIAKSVSPHIRSYANSLISPSGSSKVDKEGNENNSTVTGVMTVAGASLAGFSTVWTSLEAAGLAIARSASEATVNTVQHKYGDEAGITTGHAMGAAVNAGLTVFNLDNIGIKAIVKRTAKDTGKTVLKDYVATKKSKLRLDSPSSSAVNEEMPDAEGMLMEKKKT